MPERFAVDRDAELPETILKRHVHREILDEQGAVLRVEDTTPDATYFWLVNFDMWFFSRFVQFFHVNSGTWSLEDSDVWRLLTRTGLRVPLAHKLFGSLQYNYDWVNSPADGKKNYDDALLLKLGLEW